MCAKYYENPTMLSRVIAKNVGDVFFETHCSCYNKTQLCELSSWFARWRQDTVQACTGAIRYAVFCDAN